MTLPHARAALRGPSTLLIGNPNVGKSVLFGVLTGQYATVSNYPGTTVEVAEGASRCGGGRVLDLPGCNTLVATSEDEAVTRDVLVEHLLAGTGRVLQVCDAKNLRRGLLLTIQLAELEAPMALVANMIDESRARGIDVDLDALALELGVDVVGTVATERVGVEPLAGEATGWRRSRLRVAYAGPIEHAIERVRARLPASLPGRRGIAALLIASGGGLMRSHPALSGDPGLAEEIRDARAALSELLGEDVRFAMSRARLQAAEELLARAMWRSGPDRSRGLAQRFGELAMHPLWGVPVAAAVLAAMYLFVGVLGAGTAVDVLENTLFAGYVTPAVDAGLRFVLPEPVESFLAGPPGAAAGTGPGLLVGDYGLVSMGLSYAVAIVLPIVGFFFAAFAVLEDSGYLPRLAVLLDRTFKLMGCSGKAVLPMILGLGCDTMATLTARILPTRKERLIVTLLLALGIPCSAQLGVVMGMLASLSASATVIWLGTVALVILGVGFLASRVLPGDTGDFLMEIPPMRRPVLRNIAIKTSARVEWYLREAVPLFVAGTLVLWTMERTGLLAVVQRLAAPLVTGLLGLPVRATDALVVGFLRRDYGAAGLHDLFSERLASGAVPAELQIQVLVAMVTITLFLPCVANFLVIGKERGWRVALGVGAFVFPFSFLVGGALNAALRALWL